MKYFDIRELVDQKVYDMHGQRAFRFFDPNLLYALDTIRGILGKKITVNDWMWFGNFSQRGLRHNQSPLVRKKVAPYLSAHCLGRAVDFDVQGMTAEEVRTWLVRKDLFNFKIRLEAGVNWVHIDTIAEEKNSKVYLFHP